MKANYTGHVADTIIRPDDEPEALLKEAVEAILNLAPSVRRDRDGCFDSQQSDCGCTVCKIRRWLAANEKG